MEWLSRRRENIRTPSTFREAPISRTTLILAGQLLFFFLVSFPAFIGHTTTPLTDTLAVDLTIILLALLLWCQKRTGTLSLVLAALAGSIAAYNCLLRPAYLIPTIVSLLLFTILSVVKRNFNPLLTVIVFMSLLGTVSHECYVVYGKTCLQNPTTFDAIRHAQMGLRGGRLLWGGPYPSNGEFPILPDKVLRSEFYDRCKLERIIGSDNTSLLGCLLARPHLIPVYVVKKWIGLFDNFRFQPYLEVDTPTWLMALSRGYDSLAWVGFLFFILSCVQWILEGKPLGKINSASIAYIVFVLLMLGEHTILHPEDRFGLVLIPLASVSIVVFIERLWMALKTKSWQRFLLPAFAATMSIVLFVWQVIVWDHTSF